MHLTSSETRLVYETDATVLFSPVSTIKHNYPMISTISNEQKNQASPGDVFPRTGRTIYHPAIRDEDVIIGRDIQVLIYQVDV